MFTNLIHYNKLKFQESASAGNVAALSLSFQATVHKEPTFVCPWHSAPEERDLTGKWFPWIHHPYRAEASTPHLGYKTEQKQMHLQ